MNYYEHHIGDYAAATSHLTLLEDAIYSRLLRRYYLEEAPLPADAAKCARLAGARTQEEIDAAIVVLDEFFPVEEDGLRHNKRADEEIARYRARVEAAQENGRKGGRPRKEEDQKPKKTQPFNSGSAEKTQPKAHQTPSTSTPPTDRSVVADSSSVARDEPPSAALLDSVSVKVVEPESTRRGLICRQLRAAGIADAAPHQLTDDTWSQILAKRTDEEIVEFAKAKLADRPGQRTGLKYLAPGLLDDPKPIAPNARGSPRLTREDSRRIAASTRLSDFREASASEQGKNDERTIDATGSARLVG